MEGVSRRSLLPQKPTAPRQPTISKAPASSSNNELFTDKYRAAARFGHVKSIHANPKRPDVPVRADLAPPSFDHERSIMEGEANQQSLANIGRSSSLRKSDIQGTNVREGVQRMSPTTLKTSNSVSRIATPNARHFKTTSVEKQNFGLEQVYHPPEDVIDVCNQQSKTKDSRPGSKAQGENSLPNIAVSRHVRASSHQLPASRNPQHSVSSIPQAPPARRPTRTSKPEFSTLQQHFTPRKAPKALTSSFLVPSSSKQSDIGKTSAEITTLQAELARLYLLHQSSEAVQKAWNESAKHILQTEYDRVSRHNNRIKELSSSEKARYNYPALVDWSQGLSNVELAERLETLSRNLLRVNDFMNFDSMYNRVLKSFETWFSYATQIVDSRMLAKKNVEGSIDLVEGLGNGWKVELASMERKLVSMARELNRLEKPKGCSSLGHVVILLTTAVASMIEELETVKAIENATILSEAEWIRTEVTKIATESCSGSDRLQLHQRIWHHTTR